MAVKRDWDVIREVLIEVEELSDQARSEFSFRANELAGEIAKTKAEHAIPLHRAGYLDGTLVEYADDTPTYPLAPNLTWPGHDLLDTIRSRAVWERIKDVAKDKGIELSFDAVKAIGKGALDWVIAG